MKVGGPIDIWKENKYH